MKKTDNELRQAMLGGPMPGTLWKHYKTGNLYVVENCAILEANQEPMVVYRRVMSSLWFTRPLAEWGALVECGEKKVPRFTQEK